MSYLNVQFKLNALNAGVCGKAGRKDKGGGRAVSIGCVRRPSNTIASVEYSGGRVRYLRKAENRYQRKDNAQALALAEELRAEARAVAFAKGVTCAKDAKGRTARDYEGAYLDRIYMEAASRGMGGAERLVEDIEGMGISSERDWEERISAAEQRVRSEDAALAGLAEAEEDALFVSEILQECERSFATDPDSLEDGSYEKGLLLAKREILQEILEADGISGEQERARAAREVSDAPKPSESRTRPWRAPGRPSASWPPSVTLRTPSFTAGPKVEGKTRPPRKPGPQHRFRWPAPKKPLLRGGRRSPRPHAPVRRRIRITRLPRPRASARTRKRSSTSAGGATSTSSNYLRLYKSRSPNFQPADLSLALTN